MACRSALTLPRAAVDRPGAASGAFRPRASGRRYTLRLKPTAQTLTNSWDALGRRLSETSPLGTVTSQYDLAGRRTRITWPDAWYAAYDWDLANRTTAIRANGATSGVDVLATYAYDNLGRRTGIARGNGVTSAYGYDANDLDW